MGAFQKPLFGTPIDRSSWLFSAMQPAGMYALNEYTGGLINDGMRNLNLTATGYGTNNPWATGSQTGIKTTLTAEHFSGILPASLQFQPPISIAAPFKGISFSSDNNACPFGLVDLSIPGQIFAFYVDSGPHAGVYYTSTDGSRHAIDTKLVVTNIDYVVSATIFPNWTGIFYLNGVSPSGLISLQGASGLKYSSTTSLLIGQPGIGGNPNFISYWGVWSNTAWTPALHRYLGQNINNIWGLYGRSLSMKSSRIIGRRTLYDRVGSRGVQ